MVKRLIIGIIFLTIMALSMGLMLNNIPVVQARERLSPLRLDSVSKIVGGAFHTCLLTSGGGIKCWGYNGYGQLGDGTTTSRNTASDGVGLTSVTMLVAGADHTCALLSGGGVKCWGRNDRGQLGDGTTTSRSTPVDVVGLNSDITFLTAGYSHTCAVQSSGEVVCWGSNSAGQLGDSTGTNRLKPTKVLQIATLEGLTMALTSTVSLAAGEQHTCAVTSGGEAKCWGFNGYGQLGNGTQAGQLLPTTVSGLTNSVVSLVAADNHTCALMNDGGAKCWGRNDGGLIGDGTNDNNRLVPVNIFASGVTAIAAKFHHTCALLSNGGMKCWGNNDSGQIGDGTNFATKSPIDVLGLTSGVSNITVGSYYACALTNNGGLKCWGKNSYGEIGDGTTTKRTIPTDVFIMQATPDTLNLSITKLGGHASLPSFNIVNLVTGVMTWTASSSTDWLSLSNTSGTAPSVISTSVKLANLVVGTYNGQISINSRGGSKNIKVVLTVVDSDLQVNPVTLSFSSLEKDVNPLTQTLAITSRIASPLTWTATDNATWLKLSSAAGTTPSKLEVAVDTTGLVAGSYNDQIILISGSEQQLIPVILTVSKPTFLIDPPEFSFMAIEGSTNSATQAVKIYNTGTRQLSWRLSVMGSTTGWFNLSSWSGTTPQSVEASANVGSLKAGTYVNSAMFYCDDAQNSKKIVTTTLVVYQAGLDVVQTTSTSTPGMGESLTYNYRVTNLGLVAFDKVSLSDNISGAIATDQTPLTPGSFKQFNVSKVIGEDDMLKSSPTYQLVNMATAIGTVSNASLTVNSNLVTVTLNVKPSLAVQKSTSTVAVSKPGEIVVYHYLITNTGNITLYNLQLADDQTETAAVGTLGPGQSNGSIFLGYTAIADDLKADAITSTVSVSGTLIDYQLNPRFVEASYVHQLAVTKHPVIQVAPTSLQFQAVEGSAPLTQSLMITNIDTGSLNWTASAASVGDWLFVDPSSGFAPATLKAIVNLATLPVGTHSGQIVINSNGGFQTINVSLKINSANQPTATPTNSPTPSPTIPPTTPTTPAPVTPTTPTATPNVTPDPSTGYEPNNSCADAKTISNDGTGQHHQFQVIGDKDWAFFQAVAGVTYLLEAQVSADSLADVALGLYANCQDLPIDKQDYDFSPNVRLLFTPTKSGTYYLRLSNHDTDVGGPNVTYQLSVRNLQQSGSAGALILVAGKLRRLDPTQTNIHNVANNVYRLFTSNGYDAERIYYLATDLNLDADGGGADVDALAEKDNLQKAITVWAASKVGSDRALTLYLVDHGGYDRFYLNGQTETVTPDELNEWLNTLEAAVPGLKINIILEACHAGSFIDLSQSLSKAGRVVIASTGAYAVSYSSDEGAAFSDTFLKSLGRGSSLYTAFEEGKTMVQTAHLDQTPWLDDNGNGTANGAQDGLLAQQRGFSYANGTLPGETWPPFVAWADLLDKVSGHKGVIQAEVRDDVGVAAVWAVIYKPSFVLPNPFTTEELVQENLPTVTLLDSNKDKVYTATYEGFDEEGQYRILVYATDKDGELSQPREVLVQIGNKINLLSGISLGGPTNGTFGTQYAFVATATPLSATLPITYVWQVAGQTPMTHTVSALQDTAIVAFRSLGAQTVTVTASNDGGWVRWQQLITITTTANNIAGPTLSTTIIYTETDGYRAEVAIPAGAVDDLTEFIYTPVITLSEDTPMPLNVLFGNRAFKLEAIRHGQVQNWLTFSLPVTISLAYLPADVVGLMANSLELRYWDGRVWSPSGITMVQRDHLFAATINHLSEFALFGQKQSLGTIYLPIIVKK